MAGWELSLCLLSYIAYLSFVYRRHSRQPMSESYDPNLKASFGALLVCLFGGTWTFAHISILLLRGAEWATPLAWFLVLFLLHKGEIISVAVEGGARQIWLARLEKMRRSKEQNNGLEQQEAPLTTVKLAVSGEGCGAGDVGESQPPPLLLRPAMRKRATEAGIRDTTPEVLEHAPNTATHLETSCFQPPEEWQETRPTACGEAGSLTKELGSVTCPACLVRYDEAVGTGTARLESRGIGQEVTANARVLGVPATFEDLESGRLGKGKATAISYRGEVVWTAADGDLEPGEVGRRMSEVNKRLASRAPPSPMPLRKL